MKNSNIVNPFSPECEYWVAMHGQCWGARMMPSAEIQIEADSIHAVRNQTGQTVRRWENFMQLNEAKPSNDLVDTLKAEDGVTETSLSNAYELLMLHGEPERLEFKADKRKCNWTVKAIWPDGSNWVFHGFAWGYGGTGPAGLQRFFEIIGNEDLTVDDLPMDKFEKTDCDWENPKYYGTDRN